MRSAAARRTDQRRFWIGVGCAALVHAALIIGFVTSSPRRMGERSGQPDGISVMLVDAADLESRTTVPLDTTPPGVTGSVAPPPSPSTPQSEPAQPSEAPEPAKPKPKEAAVRAIEPEKPAKVPPPEPATKESETPPAPSPSPAPKSKPKTQAKAQPSPPLQLSMPDMALPSGGLGAAVSRPPGITRSGENDDFARGVIRALRQTMPAPSGVLGRVTVRLLLNENGNLVEVALLRAAEDPILTQSIVFAVRQASFPFPPAGANLADRTFMVTYIYR